MARIDITYDTALRAGFRDAMASNQIKPWIDALAFNFKSTQPAGETWAFLGALPDFRPWRGEITAQGLDTWSKTITNDAFHDSVFIDRNMWDFDKLGLVQAQISELANQAVNFQYKLLTARINDGHT